MLKKYRMRTTKLSRLSSELGDQHYQRGAMSAFNASNKRGKCTTKMPFRHLQMKFNPSTTLRFDDSKAININKVKLFFRRLVERENGYTLQFNTFDATVKISILK